MRFLRLDLLTLLISLFILVGCKNESTVTLPLGNQQLNGSLLVNNNIFVHTEADDTVQTSGLTKTPLSYFKDQVLGTTEANIATALSLPGGGGYTLPTGALSVDSAVLVLRYASGFYGDSLSSNYKAYVYQLDEQPLSSQVYYNNKSWKTKSPAVLLGSRSFNVRPNSVVKVTDIVTGGADTLKKLPAQLRIKLSNNFIQQSLFNATSAQLSNNAIFQDAVKGFYITLDKSQSGVGGTIMFNIDSSRVNVYYKSKSVTSVDTSVISMPLGTHAAEIRHNPSADVVSAISSTQSNPIFYLQGLGGLRTRISFPNLASLFSNVSNINSIVLNRAELVITPTPNSDHPPYLPSPQIYMYQLNKSNQRVVLQDANGSGSTAGDPRYLGTTVFGGGYDATNREYRFIITGYIQDLLRGKTVDYGTFIGPIDETSSRSRLTDPLATVGTASRAVLLGNNSTSTYRIKLNLIYTKAPF